MRRTFRIALPVAVFILLALWTWDALFIAGRTIALRNVGSADIDSVVLRIERQEYEIIDRPSSPQCLYTLVDHTEWDVYHLGTLEAGEEDGLDLLRDSHITSAEIRFHSGGKRKVVSTGLFIPKGMECGILVDVDGAADEVVAVDQFYGRNIR